VFCVWVCGSVFMSVRVCVDEWCVWVWVWVWVCVCGCVFVCGCVVECGCVGVGVRVNVWVLCTSALQVGTL